MNPLTWQKPGQLFVAQDIIKVKIYSVAELRVKKNLAVTVVDDSFLYDRGTDDVIHFLGDHHGLTEIFSDGLK